MIGYNICYSTYVQDDTIPDEKCNIMDFYDHIACIVKGSNITCNNFGIKIENLNNNKNLVLSHSEKTNFLEYKNQNNFFNQGKKECLEITFIDGTTLNCTLDHKLMTDENKWIEAKDLLINKTKLKKGICYPITNFDEYISTFEIECGSLKLNMKNTKEIEKFMKFSRLFGFLYCDGSIAKNRATCYVGDIVDAECMIDDIYSICNEKIDYKFENNGSSSMFYIRIPYSIHNSCIWKLGDGYGNRMKKDSFLPEFILNKDCPKIIKREFLAGMFGGDGLCPGYCFSSKNYTSAGLCASKYEDRLDNLKDFFESIQNILLNDFNIGSYLNGPYEKKNEKSLSMRLTINVNDLIKFHEKIGYRYCIYKMLKLEIMCSYKKLINVVFDQRKKCINIITNLKNKMSWDEAVKKAHKIMKHDIIFNNHYSLPNKFRVMDDLRRPRNGNKKTFWSKYFPSFEKYITDLNVFDLFVNNKISKASSIYGKDQLSTDTIPYYNLKVIYVKNIGYRDVYDIEVKDNHSFLANGVVVHNCEHDPKVIKRNKLTTYIDTQKEKLTELRKKRDNKINKLIKQDIIDEINKIVENLKPFTKERSDIVKTISKKPMCEKRYYRFLKEPKGVIPTILQSLLDARKNTRKIIKENKKKLERLTDENEIKNLKMLNNVLDKRQLAYKVSCNSVYGALGVSRGYLPFMPGAVCTTYMGRVNIELAAKTITEKYGGQLVYGD